VGGKFTKGRIDRARRLTQIEKLLLQGKTQIEIADLLGISRSTVVRDLEARGEEIAMRLEQEAAAYRQAILTELGQIYSEAVQDTETARLRGRHTFPYFDLRVNILRGISKLVGAEVPARVYHQHQHATTNGKGSDNVIQNGPVQIIIEENTGQFDPNHGADIPFVTTTAEEREAGR
jgi:hypothetical protein